jgi:hypothetical protein
MIVVYKDGESKIVKSRYLLRFLDAGWSQEPPKSKTEHTNRPQQFIPPGTIYFSCIYLFT